MVLSETSIDQCEHGQTLETLEAYAMNVNKPEANVLCEPVGIGQTNSWPGRYNMK
jgi:hypothetical protein